jgi:hypothetical protein
VSVRQRPPVRRGKSRPTWLFAVLIPVVALVVIGVGFGIFTLLRSGSSAEPAPTASAAPCPSVSASAVQPLPDPTEIKVNVYNATFLKGLAASTAADLKNRGFIIKNVGNDPKKLPITGVAEIRYGPKTQAAAELLQYYFPGAELINDGRRGKMIDIALGTGFRPIPPQPDINDQVAMRAAPSASAGACASPAAAASSSTTGAPSPSAS